MVHRGEADPPVLPRWSTVRRYAPYLVAALAVVLVTALILAGQGLAHSGPPAAPAGAAPALTTTVPAGQPVPATPSTTPSSSHPVSHSPTVRPVTSAPSPTRSPTPTLPGPPAQARAVQIVGAGGLCLDDNGSTSADHNRIQMWSCNPSPAQRWTLAADGTLQVVGRCLNIAGTVAPGAIVELLGCTGAPSQQWRELPSHALVSAATTGDWLCLDNPGASQQSGTQVVVQACAGSPWQSVSAEQQWQVVG